MEDVQPTGWHDDSVAAALDLFDDPQESSAWILSEGEDEQLALDVELLGAERALGERLLGRVSMVVILTASVRRRAFIREHHE